MRIASLGNATLLTTSPTRIFRGCEPEIVHELSGVIEARQVSDSATVVTATVNWTPRRAWRASTTGAKRQV